MELQYTHSDGTLDHIDFSPPFRRTSLTEELDSNPNTNPNWRISLTEELEAKLGKPLPDLDSPVAIEELEAMCLATGSILKGDQSNKTVARLLDKLVGHLIEPECFHPTFICDHPVAMSPLARQHRDVDGLTERFELFVAGKELINAYTELNDPEEQRRRFAAQAIDRRRDEA